MERPQLLSIRCTITMTQTTSSFIGNCCNLNLRSTMRFLPQADAFPKVPVIALTATATHRVREDILKCLRIRHSTLFQVGHTCHDLIYRQYWVPTIVLLIVSCETRRLLYINFVSFDMCRAKTCYKISLCVSYGSPNLYVQVRYHWLQ